MTLAFWKNALIRSVLTGLLVGLPVISTELAKGSFGDASLYASAAAVGLGAAASAIVSALSTLVGDPSSGTFDAG